MSSFVVLWIICGVISSVVASNKGRGGFGWFIIGLLLGPAGVVQGEIVNILLKIKNSFLPTKQILIGL